MEKKEKDILELKCQKCGFPVKRKQGISVGSGEEKGMPAKSPEKPLKCTNKDCGHEYGYGELSR